MSLSPLKRKLIAAFFEVTEAEADALPLATGELERWEKVALAAAKHCRNAKSRNRKLQNRWKDSYNEGNS